MCGRFSLKTTPDTLERIFGHAVPPGYRPRYNVAPGQEVLAILSDADGERAAMPKWGLVPFWAKDPSIGNRMINARAETVADKPAFRDAFRRRRCLVLADGFYEWRRLPERKQPMWVQLQSGEPFAFAGLWERWDRGQEPLQTCTILTTGANEFMRPIHERMPVILDGEVAAEWLASGTEDTRLHEIIEESRELPLQAHAVSTLVNRPANDLPECIAPITEEKDPLLL